MLEQKLAERKAQREALEGAGDTPKANAGRAGGLLTDLYNRICENISGDPAG